MSIAQAGSDSRLASFAAVRAPRATSRGMA